MKCPNCKETKLSISEREGIEIDFCPDCRGIWLDRGELDKILERARQPVPPVQREPLHQSAPRESEYLQPQHGGYYQKPYKKKKSFLEELFD